MASAGTVTLELDANSVKMIRELQKAQKQTKRSATQMKRDMANAFKGMAVAATAFGASLAALTKVSVGYGDKIAKTADKLGVGIEALQELRYAAERAGVSSNTLDMALQRFGRRAAQAAKGGGEAKDVLKQLGISTVDANGSLRSIEDMLGEVADGFMNTKDANERLLIAMKLFDSEGVALVNMLKNGSSGLNDMRQQARDLGVVLDEKLARDAEKAADKLGDLQKVLQVRTAAIVLENADAIIVLTESLVTLAATAAKIPQLMRRVGEAVAARIHGPNNDDFERRFDEIKLLEGRAVAAERNIVGIFGLENKASKELAESLRAEIKVKQDLLDADLRLFEQRMAMRGMSMYRAGMFGGDDKKASGGVGVLDPEGEDENAEKIKEIIANMVNEVKSFGMTDTDTALIKLAELGATEEQIASYRRAAEEARMLQAIQQESDDEAERRNQLQQEYNALFQQTRTPAEEHRALLERVREMWVENIITAQEYLDLVHRLNDAVEKHQTEAELASKRMAETMADAGASAFMAWVDGSRSAKEAFADMAKDMLRWLTMLIVKEAILAAFGYGSGAGGSFSLAGAFQGRASGGSIEGGTPYIVGEKGPELIVPKSSGYVVPNDKLGGSVTVNVDARESDDPGKLLALIPVIQAQVEQSIALKSRRGYI